jgi:hypothetical protein
MSDANHDSPIPKIVVHLEHDRDHAQSEWNKVEALSRILSLALIPIVLGAVGFAVQARLAEQGVKPEYVRIAVSLLQETDRTKVSPSLRSWAADLLNESSPTKLPPRLLAELRSGDVSLPQGSAGPGATCELSVSPGRIRLGQTATLHWSSSNASELLITPDVGSVGPSGTINVSPVKTTTYELSVTNPAGERLHAQATIVVTSQ